MSYSKVEFDSDVPISIANLNMLGSQYDEMKNDIILHNHDDTYYNKTTSDLKYVHVENDGEGSGCDAATIDGYTKNELIINIPKDLIIMYAGDINNLNANGIWHLCDGTLGTRNLLDRYIICCMANGSDIGTNGGVNTVTPTGTVTINEHILTIDEIPSHYHTYYNDHLYYHIAGESYFSATFSLPDCLHGGANTQTENTSYVGSNQGHNHDGNFTGIEFDKRPKSKAIYYIQKL